MNILIVDDHALIRRGMISLLAGQYKDLQTGEASNAREGLDAVAHQQWDLAIVDISMPGRNGLDLIQEIKREKPAMPVLVVSAHAEKDYALRAFKLGASGYVSKQSAPDVLVSAVERLLSGRRYVSQDMAEQLAGAVSGNAPTDSHAALSNRELEVLKLIASGHTIKEISAMLALSEKTVATYRSRIAEKMGLSSNVELTRYAMTHDLVD
jgi:two-component system invasion response regulator UvrY